MFALMDKWIESLLKTNFYSKRQRIIDKAIHRFEKKHPETATDELREKLESEADRIYAIVDRSILRDRIKRAKYTFWATGIISVVLVGSLGAFTAHAWLPFISPVVSALLSWLTSLATISISYSQRVKGAMDSVIISYEKTLLAPEDKLETTQRYVATILKIRAPSPAKPEVDSSNEETTEDLSEVIVESEEPECTPKKEHQHSRHL